MNRQEAVLDTSVVLGSELAHGSWSQRVDDWLSQISDHLNPILVKESRQAIKSRQFGLTFVLLLICGWTWSVCGLVTQLPDVYYASSGPFMLAGYYVILAIPMLLVVPFSTFRSLAAERDDGTYELLSISTLSARQIVLGKLGSALLQMMIYYSALAPCIAFTYILRGVDILSLAFLLSYTLALSILFSCVGLVAAGFARTRHWQTLVSVVFLLALVLGGWTWALLVGEWFDSPRDILAFDEPGFWWFNTGLICAWATYAFLLVQVAASQNSFASDNRSTRIRLALSLQTLILIGWATSVVEAWKEPEFPLATFCFAMMHWCVYGVFLCGEGAVLSPRVRRELPQSFLGRMLFTWFNPGSASGYLFAVSHVLLLTFAAAIAVWINRDRAPNLLGLRFIALLAIYYIGYLGAGRIILTLIGNLQGRGMVLSFLINFLLAVAGAAIPYVWASYAHNYSMFAWSPDQWSNWAWTLSESLDSRAPPPVEFIVMLAGIAGIILLVNMIQARREVETLRTAVPDRVVIEMIREGKLPAPRRASRGPWDEDLPTSPASDHAPNTTADRSA